MGILHLLIVGCQFPLPPARRAGQYRAGLLELCWMQFGDPWASAGATLLLLALWCEVQSYNVRFAPSGQVPN